MDFVCLRIAAWAHSRSQVSFAYSTLKRLTTSPPPPTNHMVYTRIIGTSFVCYVVGAVVVSFALCQCVMMFYHPGFGRLWMRTFAHYVCNGSSILVMYVHFGTAPPLHHPSHTPLNITPHTHHLTPLTNTTQHHPSRTPLIHIYSPLHPPTHSLTHSLTHHDSEVKCW